MVVGECGVFPGISLEVLYYIVVVEFIGENLQGGLDLVRCRSKGSHDAIPISIIALGVRP